MGKDYRIKGHRLLARCCYGSCLGFGFVITTITFAAMFWIIWCYLGLSIIQFSDSQRRALVNYPYVTAKTSANFSPTTSPNNPEVSLNQIPNSSTVTLDVQKNDSPFTPDKQKDLVDSGSSGLAKSSFVSSERNDKTGGRDPIVTEELRRNLNNRDIDVKHKSFEVRTVSPALHDEQSRKVNKGDGTSGIHRNPTQSEVQETSTKKDGVQKEGSELLKDDKITSKSHSEERSGPIEFSNEQAEKDSSYIDPVFIRENSRIPTREETLTEYDSRTKSQLDATRNKNESRSQEDRRVYQDSELASKDGHRVQDEDRNKDRLPSEGRYLDSDSDQRRYVDRQGNSDRRIYRDERFEDTPGRDISRRDRVSEEQYFSERKRSNGQRDSSTREDRFRDQNQDERYSEERRRNNRDRYDERYRDRVPVDDKYDERYRDRVPVDDKYDERYRDRVPVDAKYDERYRDKVSVDRYDERYRDRVPVEDRYEERYRDRVPIDDKYDERYRDRVPVGDKYDERYRDRVPVDDKYDERYRDRVPVEDTYVERYPDGRRRRGDNLDYDEKRVRENRNRDRVAQEDRYLESNRRKSSDDQYEYRPQIDEKYKDEVRKKEDIGISETRAQDGKIRSRDEHNYRDEASIKSSEDRLLDRRYDTKDDVYRYRDSFSEERIRSSSDRNRDDNFQRSRSRDPYVDRYDYKETGVYRGRTPSIQDAPDYSYPSRTDDKRPMDLQPPRERDLLSSRSEYEPLPARTSPERREYSTRNERKDSAYDASDKGQSGPYSKEYNTEMRRDSAPESRYRNGFRNQESQSRSQYNDRDRITPTKVIDSQYFSRDKLDEEDDFRPKSLSEDRRKETSLRDNRSGTSIVSTNYQNNDGTRMTARIDGIIDKEMTSYRDRKTERPRDFDNTRREYDLKSSNAKPAEEVVLDRRSYSSEVDYNGRNRNPGDSRDRINRSLNTERRDYRYEDSSSTNNDRSDEYRPSRRTDYEASDYSNRGSNSRNRDVRYDKERDRIVRDQDSIRDRFNGDRDIHRDSRLDIEDKQNRKRVDEERYEDKYETRSYDRYPPSEDEIPKVDTMRPISKDSSWDETSQSRNRRYRPENDRDAAPPKSTSENQNDETRYADKDSSMESRRDRSPLPSNRDSESRKRIVQPSNNNAQLTSRVELTRGVSHMVSSNYDPEQPLSAKDVIDAALRHSEIPVQTAKKVFYPVFDPRVSNLTSPDTIRPSERRGITVTAKKRRKRYLSQIR